MTIKQQAVRALTEAEFLPGWPESVRKTIERAVETDGEIPGYAVERVERAVKAAAAIERRMNRDIEAGERTLSQADRKRLAR